MNPLMSPLSSHAPDSLGPSLDHSEVCREMCPHVITTAQPPCAGASPHHTSYLWPLPWTKRKRDVENSEEGLWRQTHRDAEGCSLAQVSTRLPTHCDVTLRCDVTAGAPLLVFLALIWTWLDLKANI